MGGYEPRKEVKISGNASDGDKSAIMVGRYPLLKSLLPGNRYVTSNSRKFISKAVILLSLGDWQMWSYHPKCSHQQRGIPKDAIPKDSFAYGGIC